jgi:hypothetical protein
VEGAAGAEITEGAVATEAQQQQQAHRGQETEALMGGQERGRERRNGSGSQRKDRSSKNGPCSIDLLEVAREVMREMDGGNGLGSWADGRRRPDNPEPSRDHRSAAKRIALHHQKPVIRPTV